MGLGSPPESDRSCGPGGSVRSREVPSGRHRRHACNAPELRVVAAAAAQPVCAPTNRPPIAVAASPVDRVPLGWRSRRAGLPAEAVSGDSSPQSAENLRYKTALGKSPWASACAGRVGSGRLNRRDIGHTRALPGSCSPSWWGFEVVWTGWRGPAGKRRSTAGPGPSDRIGCERPAGVGV